MDPVIRLILFSSLFRDGCASGNGVKWLGQSVVACSIGVVDGVILSCFSLSHIMVSNVEVEVCRRRCCCLPSLEGCRDGSTI